MAADNMSVDERPHQIGVEAVATIAVLMRVAFGGSRRLVDPADPLDRSVDFGEGKETVLIAVDGEQGAGGDEAGDVVEVAEAEDAGNGVAVTVVDQSVPADIGAEGTAGHGHDDADVAGGSVEGGDAASGVAHHQDAVGIYVER